MYDSPRPIVSNPEISSCSATNFVEISNTCLRSVEVRDGLTIVQVIISNITADSIAKAINFPQIIECLSPFYVTLEILFSLSQT